MTHCVSCKAEPEHLNSKYSRTPLIRINWDGEPSGHANNPDNWIFYLKIGFTLSLHFGCYCLLYVPASKTFDLA
jgi:hypothetical protein